MYRSYPNVLPVTNKYIGHKIFLKAQADHEHRVKIAHSVLFRSESTPRFQFLTHLKHNHTREYELEMIKKENERFRKKMTKTEPIVDTHNHYILHSLNTGKRQREQAKHNSEIERLQKQLTKTRPSYSLRALKHDFEKAEDIKKRLTRFPPIINK